MDWRREKEDLENIIVLALVREEDKGGRRGDGER